MPKYFVRRGEDEVVYTVNAREDELFEIVGPNQTTLIVDAAWLGPGTLHMLSDARSFDALVDRDGSVLTINLKGSERRVEVLTERQKSLLAMGSGGAKDSGPEFKSPISGRVVALSIGQGDAVEEGETLIVIEAMKMENDLKSVRGGQVEFAVEVGDTVQVGDLLATVS
jgi:biotin carboxyl carrier protein